MKENKGITLVALVVTIIVLVILAGVSINLLFGQYGILKRAGQSKEDYENAAKNEQKQLNELSEKIDKQIKGEIDNENIILKKDENGIEEGNSGYLGGEYDNPYIPVGFKHIEGTWNSGYTIKEIETENQFVWVPCVTAENVSTVKSGDIVVTFQRVLPETTATTDPKYMYNSQKCKVKLEEEPASAIKTSVGTYGGFYIAKYEAGIKGTTDNYNLAQKKATNGSVKPLSKPGCGVWNYITRPQAITVAESMVNTTDGVKSGLISGEAWDTTLQWMVNASDNKTINVGYDINSENKGWYSDVSYDDTSSLYVIHTTGYYAVNNIYDMAGNVSEWTTEKCTSSSGTALLGFRGGFYKNSGSSNPAAYRKRI